MADTEGDGGTASEWDSEPVESEGDGASGVINDSVRGNLSFVGGILGGGIAYVLAFVGVSGLFITIGENDLDPGTAIPLLEDQRETAVALAEISQQAPETLGAALKLLAWVFYGAHGVSVGVADEGAVNILSLFVDSTLVYTLIPAVLLFVFGGLVALLKRADGFLGGVISGSSVLLGYFTLATVGALFSTISGGGESASVQLLPAILLAGILFPLVFGGLAGLTKIVVINVFFGGIRARL
jgi:hypothetical protein